MREADCLFDDSQIVTSPSLLGFNTGDARLFSSFFVTCLDLGLHDGWRSGP